MHICSALKCAQCTHSINGAQDYSVNYSLGKRLIKSYFVFWSIEKDVGKSQTQISQNQYMASFFFTKENRGSRN